MKFFVSLITITFAVVVFTMACPAMDGITSNAGLTQKSDSAGDGAVQIEIAVIQIRKDLIDNPSKVNEILEGYPTMIENMKLFLPQPSRKGLNSNVIDSASLERALDGVLKWQNKHDEPKIVEILARPKVCVKPPQMFEFKVGESLPIVYFERRDDGLFEKKIDTRDIGLLISGRVEKMKNNEFAIKDLIVKYNYIKGRKEIEDVPFDIGPPIIQEAHSQTELRKIPPYCFVLGGLISDKGGMLTFVCVDRVNENN